jgi:hypothetical protein
MYIVNKMLELWKVHPQDCTWRYSIKIRARTHNLVYEGPDRSLGTAVNCARSGSDEQLILPMTQYLWLIQLSRDNACANKSTELSTTMQQAPTPHHHDTRPQHKLGRTANTTRNVANRSCQGEPMLHQRTMSHTTLEPKTRDKQCPQQLFNTDCAARTMVCRSPFCS